VGATPHTCWLLSVHRVHQVARAFSPVQTSMYMLRLYWLMTASGACSQADATCTTSVCPFPWPLQYGLPVSSSQCITGGIIGVGCVVSTSTAYMTSTASTRSYVCSSLCTGWRLRGVVCHTWPQLR
jgi:hypothetical protein